jgi:hypothetical protein
MEETVRLAEEELVPEAVGLRDGKLSPGTGRLDEEEIAGG